MRRFAQLDRHRNRRHHHSPRHPRDSGRASQPLCTAWSRAIPRKPSLTTCAPATLDALWPILQSTRYMLATPVFMHAPQTIQVTARWETCLCEKPMAMNEAEARPMVRTAEETGKTFGVAYYRRCYPKVQRAKELLAAGVIGKPVFAELTNHMDFDGTGNRGWLFDPVKIRWRPAVRYRVASHRRPQLSVWAATASDRTTL